MSKKSNPLTSCILGSGRKGDTTAADMILRNDLRFIFVPSIFAHCYISYTYYT